MLPTLPAQRVRVFPRKGGSVESHAGPLVACPMSGLRLELGSGEHLRSHTPGGVARTVAHEPTTATPRPSSMQGMRIFGIAPRPDPPAAQPHEVEEAVREHLYGRRAAASPGQAPSPGPTRTLVA
jgi:hypothetical protein